MGTSLVDVAAVKSDRPFSERRQARNNNVITRNSVASCSGPSLLVPSSDAVSASPTQVSCEADYPDIMRAIYLLTIIFVVVATLPEAESGVQSHGTKPSYETAGQSAKYSKTSEKLASGPMPSRNESQPLPSRKMFFSAWGIIALILGVIILSTITYYIFILYPYICKKDASYDIMELTEVNSVCTVSDNVNNVPHALRVYCGSNDMSNNVSNDISNAPSLNR